jgi:SAM-dependent methyltransferase
MSFKVSPYAALAAVYDQIGFADYAAQQTPHYIAYAHSIDWAGRRILDLGCGTGVSTWWLSQQGYRVVGIDISPHMLAQAQDNAPTPELTHDPPNFEQIDIRQLTSPIGGVDLVLALGGVLNAIHSLRELEVTFARIHDALDPDHLLMFDVRTIRGLSDEVGNGDRVYYDNEDDLMVVAHTSFSFETLSNRHHYIIWQRQDTGWQRQDEVHIARGFPTQGIIAMLERTRFALQAVLTPGFEPLDIQQDVYGRTIFVARKA